MADNEAPKPTPTKAFAGQRVDWRDEARDQQMRLEALTLAERTLSASRSGLIRAEDGSDVLDVARKFHAFISGATPAVVEYADGRAVEHDTAGIPTLRDTEVA